ncbi:DsbA family protein [Marinomonas arenicola]|uniref:DsbA family protein n=1 Tax=Marinomonas TaxID=28253 RepID=UPI0010564D5F|nr:DsbA family protein [Marinomonas sp. KMM3893]
MKTLHYIMDPQCGWCYAVAPLIDALTQLTNVDIKIYAGGLFSGVRKRQLSAASHQQIVAMDKKITALTGQVFSHTYYTTILEDKLRILDSDTPITALLAAESLGLNPLAMLHKMQIAQFVQGRSQSDVPNLANIANELGASTLDFLNAFDLFSGEKTLQHINKARHMLETVGGGGFPTLAFEHSDGAFIKLDHHHYYGQSVKWLAYVKQTLNSID